MAKQILRIEPIHKNQGFAAKMKHNYRLGDIKNADPERTPLNKSIIDLPEGETYVTFFKNKVKELPYYDDHKLRKNGVRGYELMLSYGLKDLPEDFNVDKWAELSKEWLISEFGRDNIASAVLHMDEGTPHIHAVVIPVKDGKINGSAYFPDRQSLRDLHSRYYQYTKEVGLEPENQYMIIDHEKVGKFYNNIDMAMEENLPGPEKDETMEEYAERVNDFYKEQMLRDATKDHQIQQLKKENAAIESANRTLSGLLDERDETIRAQNETIEQNESAVRFYNGIRNALEKAGKSENKEDREFAETAVKSLQMLNEEFNIDDERDTMEQDYEKDLSEHG